MHKLALASIAAGILMLAPVTAQTSPTTNGDGQIVIAQRGDGGGGGGGGGGEVAGGAMKAVAVVVP